MIHIIVCGANGKMGQVLAEAAAKTENIRVAAGVDKLPGARKNAFPVYRQLCDCRETADIIVDFSRPEALDENIRYAQETGMPLIIATTGFSAEEKRKISDASEYIPVFFSANMALGVSLQMELSKRAAECLGEAFDIEIVEKHHNQKVDAPSGTALALAEAINESFLNPKQLLCGRCSNSEKRSREIGIHAVRGGTQPGEHSVLFLGPDEVLEIRHTAQSRQIFAYGALRAVQYMAGKSAGLYTMADMISQNAVTNIYKDDGQAMITILGMPSAPSAVAAVFRDVAEGGIKVDIISQTSPQNGSVSLSFSMPRGDLESCLDILKKYEKNGARVVASASLSKLTVEGAGMQRQYGVASKLFGALAAREIGIDIITTSETKISFCVDEALSDKAISAVAKAFSL
jgi:4-hydroxy-tetrahydrodipicolinate reductase